MKIQEITESLTSLMEDYPGLGLAVLNNVSRLAATAQSIANADDDEDIGKLKSQWVRKFYLQGKKMDLEGQAGAIDYLVRTAKENGYEGEAPSFKRIAIQGKGDKPSAIFDKIYSFYANELPRVLSHVPEIDNETKEAINSHVKKLKSVDTTEPAKKSRKPKVKGDEYDGSYDDPANELRGSQNQAAMQAVNAVVSQIAQKYGKEKAHQIRQAVQKAGNPLQALQVEIDRAGISLSESVKRKLNQLIESIK